MAITKPARHVPGRDARTVARRYALCHRQPVVHRVAIRSVWFTIGRVDFCGQEAVEAFRAVHQGRRNAGLGVSELGSGGLDGEVSVGRAEVVVVA
ncbi:hypothetical protein [Streptomyces clavifer]|uniref:hypothetical protein n=1 Tax=Streptomyces clavifer TaxID=68188 RepID=UPI0033ADC36F